MRHRFVAPLVFGSASLLLTSCSTVIGIEELTLYEGGINGGGQGGTSATGDASVGTSGAGGAQNGQSGSGQSGNGQSGNPQSEGGASDTGTSDVVALTPDAACSEMAGVQCANFATCPYVMTVLYGSLDTCLAREKIDCMSQLAAPGSGMTPALVHQCASQSQAKGCANFNVPPSCIPAGLLTDGASCWAASQCSGGTCSTMPGKACGTCTKLSPPGGPCYSFQDCSNAFDMACVGVNLVNPGHCTMGGTAGAQCSLDGTRPCRMDLWCDKGSCTNAARFKADEACIPTETQCDVYLGLSCDSTVQKCTPLMIGQIGQPCPGYICAASGMCKNPGTPGSICEAAAKDGAACDDAMGLRCIHPSLCVNKVCTLPNDRCGK